MVRQSQNLIIEKTNLAGKFLIATNDIFISILDGADCVTLGEKSPKKLR